MPTTEARSAFPLWAVRAGGLSVLQLDSVVACLSR